MWYSHTRHGVSFTGMINSLDLTSAVEVFALFQDDPRSFLPSLGRLEATFELCLLHGFSPFTNYGTPRTIRLHLTLTRQNEGEDWILN